MVEANQSEEFDVIILGAGPAGIGAASTFLKEKQVRVVVLEARDRIGGRTFTDHHGLDLGAQWIHYSSA